MYNDVYETKCHVEPQLWVPIITPGLNRTSGWVTTQGTQSSHVIISRYKQQIKARRRGRTQYNLSKQLSAGDNERATLGETQSELNVEHRTKQGYTLMKLEENKADDYVTDVKTADLTIALDWIKQEIVSFSYESGFNLRFVDDSTTPIHFSYCEIK